MPVIKRAQTRRSGDENLIERLVEEWNHEGSQAPQPTIIEEKDEAGVTRHVYVIWAAWGALDQQARSEVITEAFWRTYGEEQGLELIVAMGLTPDEARRMNLGLE